MVLESRGSMLEPKKSAFSNRGVLEPSVSEKGVIFQSGER